MKTRKIALACFVGGALGVLVALVCAPALLWLALLAGFAGGYVGYEFHEVLRAIPAAFMTAQAKSRLGLSAALAGTKAWLLQSHPFLYAAVVIVALPITVGVYTTTREEIMYSPLPHMILLLGVIFFLAFLALNLDCASLGARRIEHSYWPGIMNADPKELKKLGYREQPLTYSNALRWTLQGLRLMTVETGQLAGGGLLRFAKFCSHFSWHLFRLIHSKERLLCGIDGVLGGAVAYVWLIPSSAPAPQQLLAVLCGGLLGVAFGVANWEIVSKRILHVEASTT